MMMRRRSRRPESEAPLNPIGIPRDSVIRAHNLLQHAVEKSFQVPSDVVAAITDAQHSVSAGGFTDPEVETRFWNAYGLLSGITPVEDARRRYKRQFYVLLALLHVCQLYYLAGSLISKRLADVEAEWRSLSAAMQTTQQPGAKRHRESV
jgi:hypothetical protein